VDYSIIHPFGELNLSPFPLMADFGGMMQQAIKIKEAQMEEYKRRWESMAPYFQHTLFHGVSDAQVKAARATPVAEQARVAGELRKEGNDAFGKGDFKAALEKYERALALLWYFEPIDPEWATKKNRELRDDMMRIVDLRDKTEDEALKAGIKEHTAAVLTNIAFMMLKVKSWPLCVKACIDALEIDPNRVKALYLRAKALQGAPTSGAVQFEQAVKDLSRAAELKPKDKNIARELVALKTTMKDQSTKDKQQFSGMFDRGSVTSGEGKNKRGKVVDAQRKLQQRKAEYERLEQMAKGWAHQAQLLAKRGEKAKAEEHLKKANEIMTHLQGTKQNNGLRDLAEERPDFSNPTEEMVLQAKRMGVDLTDPDVRGYLTALEKEQKSGSLKQHVEEPPVAVNWFLIVAVIGAIMAYRLYSSGILN
jgi:tetratricopeptide (TPR) repeat protein